MPVYHVIWSIQVSAANPLEAAGKALIIQRDPRNTHTLFEVSEDEADDYHQIQIDPDATFDGLLNQDFYAQREFSFHGGTVKDKA